MLKKLIKKFASLLRTCAKRLSSVQRILAMLIAFCDEAEALLDE